MNERRLTCVSVVAATICALLPAQRVQATGVPIAGFSPLVGLSLTDEFKDDNDPSFTFFQADLESSLVGTQFGAGGTPFYDVALIDLGAAVSLITSAADASYNLQGAGFRGTHLQQLGGATGFLFATINDPMAMFATGLANRTGTAPLALNTATMKGQSSVSILTLPPESDLPNVLGIPFASQYATYIRNDQPQIFTLNGKTVRAPQIEFLTLGDGGLQGIVRRAPMQLESGTAFSVPPIYVFDFDNIFADPPVPLTEHPTAPTVLQEPGAMFLNVDVNNDGHALVNFQFFFDTGADVTVVSELNAVRLGFDPVLDEPDFTIAVIGSGGVTEEVPGFFVDQLTIQAIGGSITATNVPVVVLDVTNPADPGNIVDGIVGTNILSGRNLVVDPKPSLGGGGVGPSLYISDPVTSEKNWTTAAASGTWSTGGNWSGGAAPGVLNISNVRNVSGGNQHANVTANATVWELNVSGTSIGSMDVRVVSGVTLTTFSGVRIEPGGAVTLQDSTLDAHYVEIGVNGILRGSGVVKTGSGPIPGQVESRGGNIRVGDGVGDGIGTLEIDGRFASGNGTFEFQLAGEVAGLQHDQLDVHGSVTLDGGVLIVDLQPFNFVPDVGDSFDLITATDGLGGVFDTYLLPDGFVWNITYDEQSVVASVIGLGVSGDFNLNGVVDTADYAVWRNGLGTTYQQADYKIWRANFGRVSPLGAGATAGLPTSAVPEPAGGVLLIVATLVGLAARRR